MKKTSKLQTLEQTDGREKQTSKLEKPVEQPKPKKLPKMEAN